MPNRSRTPVSAAAPASNPNKPIQTKAQYLAEAFAMGREYSEKWTQMDPALAPPRAAWRAIGYADAVLSFEHGPLLAEQMQEWEKGFDAELEAASPAENTVPHVESQPRAGANPYYKNHDRAPYELGHLLQQLPADFGLAPAAELKHVQIASAAETHAHVAGSTILSGIEAIGQLMEAAGTSGEESTSPHTMFCLGGLLRHLAVEGQYLRGVGDSLAFAVALYGKRDAESSNLVGGVQ
jgi:hypothetical protein